MRTSPFTAEHEQLRHSIRRVVDVELAPHADTWERTGRIDDGVWTRLGELGHLGLGAPSVPGGEGADAWADVVFAEELPRCGSGSLAMVVAAHTDLVVPLLAQLGTDAQRQAHLASAVRGELIATVAIGGPDDGPEARAIRTRARRDGNDWLLDASRLQVTNGRDAQLIVVAARTDELDDVDPWHGISLFLVDPDLPGVEVAYVPDMVGAGASGTVLLDLDGVRVPADALLGTAGGGGGALRRQLQRARLLGAVREVGAARSLFERTVTYTRQRQVFGRPIARFQVTRHRLVDLATGIELARQLTYDVCDRWSRGEDVDAAAAMCKLAAGQLSFRVADDALQLHGGYGYSRELPIERAWRDARLARLTGGSDEAVRRVIGSSLGRPDRDPSPSQPTPDRTPPRPATTAGPTDRPLFGAEHDTLRERARRFIDQQITPHVEQWEHDEDFPRELFLRVGEAGFLGLKFGVDIGGSGPDLLGAAVWIEELSRTLSGGLAADLGATTDLAALYVDRSGSDELRHRVLPATLRGERIGALGITEPGAGSDVAALTTRAVRDGDDWVLDGQKVFITNGAWCDWAVIAAKVSVADGAPSEDPHGRITLFVVDADTPGFERRRLPMLGWRTSHTGELSLAGVRVPDANRIGDVGSGFAQITRAFAWERTVMALGAVAAAQRTLELALDHLRAPATSGPPIDRGDGWEHRIADASTRIALGRALSHQALRLVVAQEQGRADAPDDITVLRTVAMAKLATQRMSFEVADEAVQMHGDAGYTMDNPVQRAWRDARLGPIGGGTDEIMREIVAKTFGL